MSVDDPRDLYHNMLLSVDRAKDINNGQPSSLALWIDALALKPGERVYHLGCGVGYYTATIAETVGPIGQGLMIRIRREGAAYRTELISPVVIYSGASLRDATLEPQLLQGLASVVCSN